MFDGPAEFYRLHFKIGRHGYSLYTRMRQKTPNQCSRNLDIISLYSVIVFVE